MNSDIKSPNEHQYKKMGNDDKPVNDDVKSSGENKQKQQLHHAIQKKQSRNIHSGSNKNGNKDNRNRYREPDFEFEGIIESEGVLDMMQDG